MKARKYYRGLPWSDSVAFVPSLSTSQEFWRTSDGSTSTVHMPLLISSQATQSLQVSQGTSCIYL